MNDSGLDGLEPSEELGRGVFSSRVADRAPRSVPHNVFLERAGITNISVDRLSIATRMEALRTAQETASRRGRDRSFYGWAVVIAGRAAQSNRRVQASPQPKNPLHADIVLPDSAREERDEQVQHARELANVAHWEER